MEEELKRVAVIDIGKTHVRLMLVSENGDVIEVAREPTPSLRGAAYRAFDIERIWTMLLRALRLAADRFHIDAIIPVTHGACAVFVDAGGELVGPVLDYEHDIDPDGYESIRPDFRETGSPSLPKGLNLGRQLFWLESREPARRRATILLYPQYWAFRLSGERVSEVTSLGCHTDVWSPQQASWSSLARDRGWDRRFAPLRPFQPIGSLRKSVAEATGLPATCEVYSGLHDSNAALVPYLSDDRQWLLSTGTWFVAMAPGVETTALDPSRDTLVNVDYRGTPVATARFMGGREFELAGGGKTVPGALRSAAMSGHHILPNLSDSGGPFTGQKGVIPEVDGELRRALAHLYAAEMAHASIGLLGRPAKLVLDGPAANSDFAGILASLLPETEIRLAHDPVGPAYGAASLVMDLPQPHASKVMAPDFAGELRNHLAEWQEQVHRREP